MEIKLVKHDTGCVNKTEEYSTVIWNYSYMLGYLWLNLVVLIVVCDEFLPFLLMSTWPVCDDKHQAYFI